MAAPGGRDYPERLRKDAAAAAFEAPRAPAVFGPGERVSEGVILGMVVLAPWAFGSVDAWAELALDLAVAILALLGAIAACRDGRVAETRSLTGMAVAGLAVLALAQAAPLPMSVLRWLDPVAASMRADLMPAVTERVAGDASGRVAAPLPTISENREASVATAARLAAAWILFGAVVRLDPRSGAFRRFALAVLVNATLLAMFALVQWLGWDGRVAWLRTSPRPEIAWYSGGPFVCHNHLAAYLNLGLGFALGSLLAARWGDPRFRGRGSRSWVAFALAVLLVGLIASHSRGGLLAAAAAGAALFGVVRKVAARPGANLVLVAIVVPLFLLVAGDASPLRRIASLAEASEDARWTVWREALRAWWVHPIWGTGMGSFPVALLPFGTAARSFFFARAENEYLDVLVEAGLVGFALAASALAAAISLARRAPDAFTLPSDRALVLGAWFGALALVFHWLCDFSLHVPGVGVAAVVLCAHLCRLGIAARPAPIPVAVLSNIRTAGRTPNRFRALAGGLSTCLVSAAIVLHGYHQARAEACLRGSSLPPPDTSMPGPDLASQVARPGLERMEQALESALRARPDWAEGHLRLGLVRLRLYERAAAKLVTEVESDPAKVALLSSPIWLHSRAHGEGEGAPPDAEVLLAHEPVRRHLVPAAHSFLEARRSCPVLALPHAGLALVDYLLIGGDTTVVYAARAARQAGADGRVLELAGVLSAQSGGVELAVECWRRRLEIAPAAWESVAASAGLLLPPDVLLERILPPNDGRLPVWFAERLYAGAADRPARLVMLQAALERLPRDAALDDAQRLAFQAKALAGLGRRDEAVRRMTAALTLEPLRGPWRHDLLDWLVAWDRLPEAHREAVVGFRLDPQDRQFARSLEALTDALARGRRPAGESSETEPLARPHAPQLTKSPL